MSKIGKNPISIPEEAEIELNDNFLKVTGPKGSLEKQIPKSFNIEIKDNKLSLAPKKIESKQTKALWGTWRSLINSMIEGVTKGFGKTLIYKGIGYKANVEGDTLNLSLGFSHPIKIEIPKDIEVKTEKNSIIISGADKQLVGQIAARIRKLRPPEPYKGSGIRYKDEVIRRKEGKKAVTSGF